MRVIAIETQDIKENTERLLDAGKRGVASLLRLRLGLSFLAFVVIGANDGALGVLLPSLRTAYGLDKATVSLLFLGGTAGYLSGAFTSGPLVGRLGLRQFMALATGVFVLGAALMLVVPPFVVAWLAFLFLGFGSALMDAGLNSYIAGLPSNSAPLNYLHAFYGLGALLGPVVASGVLAVHLDWNLVYVLWVALGVLLAVGSMLFFAGRTAVAVATPSVAEPAEQGNVLAGALKMRVVWIGAFFLLLYVGMEVSLGVWSYSILTEGRGQAPLLSGWEVSGYWMGLTLGRLVLAKVVERVGNRRMVEICLVGVTAGVLLFWLVPGAVPSAVGLWLAGFALGPIFPTTIALMSQIVPPRLLPSAIGFLASLGSMGAALFPWIAGNIAEHIGLWAILPYVVILTAATLLIWFWLQAMSAARASSAGDMDELAP